MNCHQIICRIFKHGVLLCLMVSPFVPTGSASAGERAMCLNHPRNGVLRAWPTIKEGCYNRLLHGRLVYRENVFKKMACDDTKAKRKQRRKRFDRQYTNRCTCENALRLVETKVKPQKKGGIKGLIKRFAGETPRLHVEIRNIRNRKRVYQLGFGLKADGFTATRDADKGLTKFRVIRRNGEPPSSLGQIRNGDQIKLEHTGKQGSSYVNFAGDTLIAYSPKNKCP